MRPSQYKSSGVHSRNASKSSRVTSVRPQFGNRQSESVGEILLATTPTSSQSNTSTGYKFKAGRRKTDSNYSNATEDLVRGINSLSPADADLPSKTGQDKRNVLFDQGCSYSRRFRREIEKCYEGQLHVRDYFEKTSQSPVKRLLLDMALKVIRYRSLKNQRALEQTRTQIVKEHLLNIFIYDVQTTGLPQVLEDGTLEYPDIIEIALFHPLTGRTFRRYVTPTKPISYEVGRLSGIYNSSELRFSLWSSFEPLSSSDNGHSIEGTREVSYINASLYDTPEVKDIAISSSISKSNSSSKSLFEESLESGLQEYLSQKESGDPKLVFLDDLDFFSDLKQDPLRSPRRAPFFSEILASIIEFISSGEEERSTTILMSHNGSIWGEPILREQIRKTGEVERMAEWVFVDSKEIYGNILSSERISSSTFSRLLGEDRVDAYDALINTVVLWGSIEYIFESLFERKDIPFLYSKLAEEFYMAKSTIESGM